MHRLISTCARSVFIRPSFGVPPCISSAASIRAKSAPISSTLDLPFPAGESGKSAWTQSPLRGSAQHVSKLWGKVFCDKCAPMPWHALEMLPQCGNIRFFFAQPTTKSRNLCAKALAHGASHYPSRGAAIFFMTMGKSTNTGSTHIVHSHRANPHFTPFP